MTASIIDVALVDPVTLQPVTAGVGDTAFAFELPPGAKCPADSATGGFRVNSLMVPANLTLDRVTFDTRGPRGGFPLFDHGHPFLAANTALHSGLVTGVPPFDLTTLDGAEVQSGTYRIGIACTSGGALRTAWTSVIEVTSGGARPHLSWRVAEQRSASVVAGAQTSRVTSVMGPAVTARGVSAATNTVVADTTAMVVQPVVAEVVSVAMPAAGPASATESSAGWSAAALVVALLVVTCAWRVVIRRRSV